MIRAEKPAEDPNTAAQSTGPAGPDDKLICHREKVVGSHMKQNVCEYESERQRQRENAQRMLRERTPTQADPMN
jgi:hypothetical protein